MKEKKLMVSPLFIDIYTNFNVFPQVEKMKSLTRKELFLLLTLCWDKFDPKDPVVKENLMPFKDESLELFDMYEDRPVTEKALLELIEDTGDQYVDVDVLVDVKGEPLSDPLTKQEVRDKKINLISK